MIAQVTVPSVNSIDSKLTSPEPGRPFLIRKAAVLGAGTMGSRIAAHFANAGVPVVLLDIVPSGAPANDRMARDRIVTGALESLQKTKPAAFFDPKFARLITVGNFEDDLKLLADCDWIIEAVAENLEIKRGLLAKVEAVRRSDAIVTTNTSGLPVGQIAEGMSDEFRRNWFGTHFFNPPRYMRLLEIIPTPETDTAAIAAVVQFADQRLGKAVVFAKDTPNFVANRIGTFALMNAIRVMQAMDLTIEQVDALTGSALGWPKTGTFRLADMVGIDVLAHVAKNFQSRVSDERADVRLPEFADQMLQRKWFGDKTGQGFYKKLKGGSGEDVRLGLDWKTLEYRPSERAKFPSLEAAKNVESLAERVKMLLSGDPKKDPAAAFYWQVLPDLWNYAAYRVPEISNDVVGVDLAMKTGFNWELGPFELWDAAGVPETVARMKAAGMRIAPAAERLLAGGHTTWYRDDPAVPSGRLVFDPESCAYVPVKVAEGVSSVQVLKKANGVVSKIPERPSSIWAMASPAWSCTRRRTRSARTSCAGDARRCGPGATRSGFRGFVITGDAEHFSVGANLMQLLLSAQEEEWDEVDFAVRAFQRMTAAIKFCPRPVVVAPFSFCLGGGAEIAMHGARRQAHAELYMGLVETGVGVVPAGGGCKEMLLRAVDVRPRFTESRGTSRRSCWERCGGPSRRSRWPRCPPRRWRRVRSACCLPGDRITMNRERLLHRRQGVGSRLGGRAATPPPVPRTDIPGARREHAGIAQTRAST